MAWAKLDDKFHSHHKILKVGLAGSGLYARALAYCADYETDGFVPREWVELHTGNGQSEGLANELSKAGLWEQIEDGYRIRRYLDRNPSRAQLEERRQKDASYQKGRRR